MPRHFVPTKTITTVSTIETTIAIVGKPFVPSRDPFQDLSTEIEKCRKQIWRCVNDVDGLQQRQAKKVKVGTSPIKSNPAKTQAIGSKAMVSHNKAEVEFKVNAMKVSQMRDECNNLGVDSKGTKNELKSRILEHWLDVKDTVKPAVVPDPLVSSAPEPAKIHVPSATATSAVDDNGGLPTNMEDAEESLENEDTPAEMAAVDTAEVAESGPAEVSNHSQTKSPLRGFITDVLKAAESSTKSTSSKSVDETKPDDDVSPPASEVNSNASSSVSKFPGSRVREIVSKLSSQSHHSSSTHGVSGGSALSKSVQAKKEARMARMAEIREKSQQAKSAGALGTSVPSLTTTTLGSTGPKKNLAAQMREKAMRRLDPTRAAPLAPTTNVLNLQAAGSQDALGSTLKTAFGGAMKSGISTSAATASKAARSPMDTYEISDREDSDTDDSDDDGNEKKKKRIPSWARKENLLPALEDQYLGCVDGHRVDPDEIFPEVESCDLEAIFAGNKKNTKYRSRTSSGNWLKDRVTTAEKLVYKRTMGFASENEVSEI
eukprot:Nitzschia sp. Nitz4//scaffold26_size159584//80933//82702//NITZ4_002495-RA/size159584-snap-gene-0.39-mRNA-1//-1//CDS//3329545094//151//frame0